MKITNFKSALRYSFGVEDLPPRELDLYTKGAQLTLFDYENINCQILNGTDIDTNINDIESLKTSIFQHTENTFKFISSCDCGYSTGNFREGVRCNKCGTIVKSFNADVSQFRSMFQIHTPCPKIIHPIAYRVLHNWLGKKGGVSRLDMILLHEKLFPIELKEAGFEFGLTAFERDFDRIISFLSTKNKFVTSDAIKKAPIALSFIDQYRHLLFIRKLPILNKSLHIITSKKKSNDKKKNKNEKIFTDSQVGIIMQMYHILNEIQFSFATQRRINTDISAMKLALTYYSYINEIINKKLSKKNGFIQQDVIAGRFFNSIRGVITPTATISELDEIHIPWTTGVVALKLEIINLLRNRYKYSFNDAILKHYKAISEYDPEIHKILNTLIAECPYKGLPVIWGRNPALNIGSIQLVFITVVKADVNDKTISMHNGIVKAPNADHDGDEMFGFIIKEMGEVAYFLPLHPMFTMIGFSLSISDKVEIVNRMALHNWLNEEEGDIVWQ